MNLESHPSSPVCAAGTVRHLIDVWRPVIFRYLPGHVKLLRWLQLSFKLDACSQHAFAQLSRGGEFH